MKKYIYLISVLLILVSSCDFGLVDIMDKEEYAEETGMEVKDLSIRIEPERSTYYGQNTITVRFYLDDVLDISTGDLYDLEDDIDDNIEITNGSAYFYTDSEFEYSSYYSSTGNLLYLYLDITPNGLGDLEITLPAGSISLPYDEDRYMGYYNINDVTLKIEEDPLASYYDQGLSIDETCSISSHEYIIADSDYNRILLIDSDTGAVTGECSFSFGTLAQIKYSDSENMLYMLEYYSSDLHVVDLSNMTFETHSYSTGYDPGRLLELDSINRRIYIVSSYDDLFTMDMDDYSVKINGDNVSANYGMALDISNSKLYVTSSYNIYSFSIAGDTVTSDANNSINYFQGSLVGNNDFSELYYVGSGDFCTIDTSDLSSTSNSIQGSLEALFEERDLYFTLYDASYYDFNLYKYSLSSHALLDTIEVDYNMFDGCVINTDGTEALVYNDSSSVDYIYYIDLE